MTNEPPDPPQVLGWVPRPNTRLHYCCVDCGLECEAGVEALYRAYAQPLLRFVRRLAIERGLSEAQLDAEGVVQETFEQMLRDSGKITNPPAWLYTVARRRVGRATAAGRQIAPGDPSGHIDGAGVSWFSVIRDPAIEDIVAARAVMRAIADLPARQRVATYLRQVQGWSLAEIGEYLDCAASTAGVHAHRGTRAVYADTYGADTPQAALITVDGVTRAGMVRHRSGTSVDRSPEAAPGRIRRLPIVMLFVVMAAVGGLLAWLGVPLWLVIVGTLAPLVLAAGCVLVMWMWEAAGDWRWERRRRRRLIDEGFGHGGAP